MAKITGLGGVFINMKKDIKTLMTWYEDVLGLDMTAYGINFLVPNQLSLITFSEGDHDTTLNFTVDDLESFMRVLEVKNVKVLDGIKAYDYGKFARIADPHGHMIELWEPFVENYIEMVKKEMIDHQNKR